MYPVASPPIYTSAAAVYPYDKGIEASLVFESKFDGPVSLTQREGLDRLLVPRKLAAGLGKDMRIERPVFAIDCNTQFKKPPRNEDQQAVIAKSIDLLRQDVSHVVEAPTGFGKTYVGVAVAAGIGQHTLILVTKQDLVKQWVDTLVHLMGVPPDEIGIAQADKFKIGNRFTIGMVQSVIRPEKYGPEFFNAFGLIIFDETHRMAATCFSRACFMFPGKYRLGLSATPKRTDGKTPVIAAHIGQVLVKGTIVPMSPKVLITETGWKVPSWMSKVDPGKLMGVYKSMGFDAKRNGIIVQFIRDAYAKGRTTVVMAVTLDHLKKLQLLCGAAGLPGEDMGFYTGEQASNKSLLKLNAHKRIVFCTYGMTSEGTDYPHWDTLVLVHPRSNAKQAIGRILRSKDGKKQPVILDLVDNHSIFKAFLKKRLEQYYSVGATVKMVNV